MASLTKENSNGRKGWRLRFYLNGKRRSLWLGEVSKRIADGVSYNVDRLVQAKEAGQQADAAQIKWATSLEGRMKQTLVGWGLAEPTAQRLNTAAGKDLGPFLDAYIEDRTDLKPGTKTNYRQCRRLLVEYFKADRSLRSITAADADRWRRWLLARVVQIEIKKRPASKEKPAVPGRPEKTMATATVSKHIKRAKTMFADAVRDRLIERSPFADQKGSSEANKDRHHFIDRTVSAAVLKACPDQDWRVIFALARFAGMRCPSEVSALRWHDVLWDQNRLRIESSKTGLRFCPIFPELRPVLETAFDNAPTGAIFCVGKYGGNGDANLSTQLKRIVKNAGLQPWPKTFINLRSTRRTELQEAFPSHVVDQWLGHSTKTAEKHYLQVTEDHWQAGATTQTGSNQNGGPTGGPISVNLDASAENQRIKKPCKMQGLVVTDGVETTHSVTPTGLEPVLPA